MMSLIVPTMKMYMQMCSRDEFVGVLKMGHVIDRLIIEGTKECSGSVQ